MWPIVGGYFAGDGLAKFYEYCFKHAGECRLAPEDYLPIGILLGVGLGFLIVGIGFVIWACWPGHEERLSGLSGGKGPSSYVPTNYYREKPKLTVVPLEPRRR